MHSIAEQSRQERISKLADKAKEITQSEQQKEDRLKDKKNPWSLKELQDYKKDLTLVSLDSCVKKKERPPPKKKQKEKKKKKEGKKKKKKEEKEKEENNEGMVLQKDQ